MKLIKRSVMTLYSSPNDMYSHQVRMVLAEKGVGVDIILVDENHPSEDLLELNPYNTLPTLIDRELVLYNAHVIMEYLDERFPHPPLFPVYPVARAKCRLMMHRIKRDWYSLAEQIEKGKDAEKAKKELQQSLVALAPVFGETPYFLSEEFTLVDCSLSPLLWRFPHWGIELPSQCKSIQKYAERVFKRDSFKASLTETERELREV
jgi:RNA polymerase-associated protein